MPSREQICDQCDAYVAAVAARDAGAIVKVFAPDATQEEPVGAKPNVGHDEIRTFFEASQAVPFTVSRIGPITVSGDVAAFQIRVDFDGEVMPPMSSTDIVTFDDQGLIKSLVAIPDLAAHPDLT
jgi:steroid delta-isomerase